MRNTHHEHDLCGDLLPNGLEILQGIVKGEIALPTMAETIPMRLIAAEPGKVVFTARAGVQHLNPLGGVHGGFAATVLDSATGCAVHSMLDHGVGYGTVDLNVKMLKPVPLNRDLLATGKLIHLSRSLGVADATLEDKEGTIYAHATATCLILRPR